MSGPAGTPCPVCGGALARWDEDADYTGPPRFWCPNLACPNLPSPVPLPAPAVANAHPGEAGFCTHGLALATACTLCGVDNEQQPEMARIYPTARNYTPSAAMDAARAAAPAAPVEAAPVAINSRPEIGAPTRRHLLPGERCVHFSGHGTDHIASSSYMLAHGAERCSYIEPPVEHPGPWRWDEDGFSLDAANGAPVLTARWDDIGTVPTAFIEIASPRVRALTEAAPTMEALLRRVHLALRATLQALPKSVKTYPPGAVEASVDAAMFLEALDRIAAKL